jgi:hypothetical protein
MALHGTRFPSGPSFFIVLTVPRIDVIASEIIAWAQSGVDCLEMRDMKPSACPDADAAI